MMTPGILEAYRLRDGMVIVSEQAVIAFVIPRLDLSREEPR